jgi:hypothetical protein
MTEHEEEYLRERRAEADAGARERRAGPAPGPWEFGEREWQAAGAQQEIVDAEGEHIGWIECYQGRDTSARLACAAPALLVAVRLAHAALDAATSTLAGLDLSPGSRLDDLCGELAAAREACEGALGRVEGEED